MCSWCREQIADIFRDVHMADHPPRTGTGGPSCNKSSTATAKSRTSSPSTDIVTDTTSQSSQPSSTSMAIPTSSNCPQKHSLELEQNCDQRPWDSYPWRNELTAVVDKIETRQYSKDKPLDFAEEVALDWKRVANDDPEIARWLNAPRWTQSETNYFSSRPVEPHVKIGSELTSASGCVSVSCSSGLQQVTYGGSSSGSYLAQPAIASSTPTQHHGAKERLEGISYNSSLNPQQELYQSQHCPENVSVVPRTRHNTETASGPQEHRSRSNARSSAQHDTPSASQGYASSSAVSNSQQQSREYISHTERKMRYAASPYPPPAYRRLLTTQTDTPSSLPVISCSFALGPSQQQHNENASLVQTTSDYGSSPNRPIRTALDHSSPTAKADLLRYNHQAFCESVKTARERANISQGRLASILCISCGAKFPNTKNSINRFRSRLFGDAELNSLYPIFKAWLDEEDRNVSSPRDTSTTKSGSGRAHKRLSEDQYAVLTHEFARDLWPSTQRLAQLANSFAVTTKPYGSGLTINGPRRILEKHPELNWAVNVAPANPRIHKTKEWMFSMDMKRILLKSLTPNVKHLGGHFPEVIGNLLINNHNYDGHL